MVKAALKNPHAVVVLALAILVIGLTAIAKLPTDILPTFKTPAVQIVTFYPGMPAEVMEKDIMTRLERWTGQSNGTARHDPAHGDAVRSDRDDPTLPDQRVESAVRRDETLRRCLFRFAQPFAID